LTGQNLEAAIAPLLVDWIRCTVVLWCCR